MLIVFFYHVSLIHLYVSNGNKRSFFNTGKTITHLLKDENWQM